MFEKFEIVIEDAKIVDYLLNKNHKDGFVKANFFLKCGFDVNEKELFKKMLLEHLNTSLDFTQKKSEFGVKFVVEGIIVTPNNRKINLRSVWINPVNEKFLKFVTAYPQ